MYTNQNMYFARHFDHKTDSERPRPNRKQSIINLRVEMLFLGSVCSNITGYFECVIFNYRILTHNHLSNNIFYCKKICWWFAFFFVRSQSRMVDYKYTFREYFIVLICSTIKTSEYDMLVNGFKKVQLSYWTICFAFNTDWNWNGKQFYITITYTMLNIQH